MSDSMIFATIVVLLLVAVAAMAYLTLLVRRLGRQGRDSGVPASIVQARDAGPIQASSLGEIPDIVIAPLDIRMASAGEDLPSELGTALEPIFRSIPAFSNLLGSSGKLFRVTFSPEVTKGLAENSLSYMRSGGNFRAIAVDGGGKIVGHGQLSLDRAVSSIAAVSAVWQVLAIVTAQKFLSDINERLAGIEESVKRLELWLDAQEQGRFLGSMKYLAEISRGASQPLTADEALLIRTQVERIYHESLQSKEANILRASASAGALMSKDFRGNIEEKSSEFRKMMDAYFVPASYAIRFTLVAAYSEYVSALMDRRPGRELRRIDSIIQESEVMLTKIRDDAELMKKKAGQLSGKFWDLDEDIKSEKKSLRDDMATLLSSCEGSIERVRKVHEATTRIGAFVQDVEQKGLNVVVGVDGNGKVTRIQTEPKK